jgi:hypothetical protein
MPASYQQRMHTKQIYSDLIGSHLMKRGRGPDDFKPHPDHPSRTCYEVRMCQHLLATLHSRGFHGLTVQDVFRNESSAAGHSDYQHKLALYCAFLEEESAPTGNAAAQTRGSM